MAAGNATIGSLRVELGLDSATLQSGLKEARANLAEFGKSAAVAGAAVGAAMAAAAVAMAVAVRGVIDNADELGKVAQKVGVSVEALSRLKYAGELADVSLEQLSAALKKLGVNMAEAAAKGGGKASEAFNALGVSVTDANGALKTADAVLVEVAGKFAQYEDGAAKTALAVALFGKAGSDMIPLLNEGSAGLAAMAAEADKLGLTISTETAASAEAFNDNLTRLGAVTNGVTAQIGAAMLPALEALSNAFVASAQNADFLRAVGQTLGGVLKVLATAAVVVGGAFAELAYILASTVNATLRALVGDFAGAQRELQWGGKGMVDTFKGSAKAIEAIWTSTGAKVAATAPAVGAQLAAPMIKGAEKVAAAGKAIKSEADRAGDALRNFIAAENDNLANRGQSAEQQKIRALQAKASEAVALGMMAEADALVALIDKYRQLQIELAKTVDGQVEFVRTSADLNAAIGEMASNNKATFEDLADGFYEIGNAVDDVFYGIKNNDWVGAFSGLTRALDKVKAAFSAAGTAQDRFSAVAGVAQAAGSAIGGKAGGALSGAASGAATGMALGGPIGAGIGAVIGGISGFLGASKAKKRAKKEAAARAKAEEEQRLADLANASRALDIELMRAQGKTLEALAAERADELAAADESLRERMKALYALRDQADAEASLTAIRRQLLNMTDAAAAAELDRAEILKGLPDGLRDLQSAVWAVEAAQAALTQAEQDRDAAVAAAQGKVEDARDVLSAAYERSAGELEDTASRFGDLADELAALNQELAGTDLGGLDPGQQLDAAKAAFDAVKGRTDEASLAALPQAARDYLAALNATAPDQKALAAGIADVRRATMAGEAAAREQVTNAEAQLAALQASVTGLITLNDSVITVQMALDGLAVAIIESAAEQRAAMDAVAAAARAAADAAAAAKTANDNASVNVGGFDAAAVTAAMTSSAASAAVASLAGGAPSDAMVAALDTALSPYFVSLIKQTGKSADLLQQARDEADAA